MTVTASHGGHCCGRRHLYNFNYNDDFQQRHDTIQRTHGDLTNLVTEVVLTTGQLPRNAAMLRTAGYRKVASWRNSNSGNVCHMFLHGRDVSYTDTDQIYVGSRVRVKASGNEGIVLSGADGRASVRYDNGNIRTVKVTSLVNISEKI